MHYKVVGREIDAKKWRYSSQLRPCHSFHCMYHLLLIYLKSKSHLLFNVNLNHSLLQLNPKSRQKNDQICPWPGFWYLLKAKNCQSYATTSMLAKANKVVGNAVRKAIHLNLEACCCNFDDAKNLDVHQGASCCSDTIAAECSRLFLVSWDANFKCIK